MRDLGDRMKGYEAVWNLKLPKRLPVILRIDGKNFHNWTKGLKKPFSDEFISQMNFVAMRLAHEISGARLAYVQSDEISILIHNYQTLQFQPWFENEFPKMVSISAGLASAEMTKVSGRVAVFDSRVFILPESEVANYFYWRQTDASRNSIQMLARSLYSHGECYGKNSTALQEMCWRKGQNWNDLPTHYRRGRCIVRENVYDPNLQIERSFWKVDNEIPIWVNEHRSYIEDLLLVDPSTSMVAIQDEVLS